LEDLHKKALGRRPPFGHFSFGILLALGKYGPAYSWLYQNIPVFRYGRYPVKFLVVISFCFSLLVGFGLERLEGGSGPRLFRIPKRTLWGVLLFASFV
jgi:hypothetical protein